MIEQKDWEWFGDAGHFICGRWCRFHLCTKVGKYLISTIGSYVHPMHSKSSETTEAEWLKENWPGDEVGMGRKFETMVFIAGKRCDSDKCGCGMPVIDGSELECLGCNTPGEAAKNHIETCLLYATK